MTNAMTDPYDGDDNVDDVEAKALDAFLKAEGKLKEPGAMLLSGSSIDVETIPTGALSLDIALGCGGIPRGRVTELYGQEGSGKTTLALEIAANAQRQGGNVAFIDAEHALNLELCDNIGIDPDRFVIYAPSSGEDAIDKVKTMAESGAFRLISVDSVAHLTPTAVLDKSAEQIQMGGHARLMSKFMQIVTGPCSNSNTALVLINQVRTDLNGYGNPLVTTGGKGIKFAASVRISVMASKSKERKIFDDAKNQIGQGSTATVVKNKFAPPQRTADYDLVWGQGIVRESCLLEAAIAVGVIGQSGSSYYDNTTGERIAIGRAKVQAALGEDPEMYERLVGEVYKALEDGVVLEGSGDDTDEDGDED